MKSALKIFILIFLIVFGLLTLFMSISATFDLFGMRAGHEHFVPFVVYANMFCGLLYVLSAYKLINKQSGARKLLLLAIGILILTLIAFSIHVAKGGEYDQNTFYALAFRTGVTALLAWMSKWYIHR